LRNEPEIAVNNTNAPTTPDHALNLLTLGSLNIATTLSAFNPANVSPLAPVAYFQSLATPKAVPSMATYRTNAAPK
jgi:hypothetical protein